MTYSTMSVVMIVCFIAAGVLFGAAAFTFAVSGGTAYTAIVVGNAIASAVNFFNAGLIFGGGV